MGLRPLMIRVQRVLPAGSPLPDGTWRRRQRWMTTILLAHVAFLTVLMTSVTDDVRHIAADMAPITIAATVAALPQLGRRWRMAAATLGLVACSALLVHATDGLIESHFHFFAVIAIVTLYQQWLPFVLAFVFVVVHHGLVGVLDPTQVYNHEAAWNRPVLWAFIHGCFVALAAAANLIAWRLSEDEREGTEQVLNATGEALFGVDRDGRVTFANPAMSRLTGWAVDEMHGAHHHTLLGHADGDGRAYEVVTCPVCASVSTSTGQQHDDQFFARRDGGRFPVQYSSHPVGASARADGLVAVVNFQDITQRRAFHDELARRALHDSLTGLPNRTLLLDHIALGLAKLRRDRSALAVIFCDLDRFKRINDSLGHDAGDRLLRQLATRLTDGVRPGDTVARFGGDEFVICCPDLSDVAQAERIARRLIDALDEPFDVGPTTLHVEGSFGVAVTRDPDIDAAEMIRRADQAMYAAKESGGGVRAYEATMSTQATRQVLLEEQLRGALVADQLELYYQRTIELAGGRVLGVEALLRWNHPDDGVLAPATFIPVAESTGLIMPIGTWVLEQACRQVAAWNARRDTPLSVGVNVSARQLRDPGFADLVTRVLLEARCDPTWLLLEITESTVIGAIDTAAPSLATLRDIGVHVAIDDFGTGFSSLTYLRQLPVDVLKVDRSFVTGVDARRDQLSLVAAVVNMARSLSMRTIAEGVESDAERAALATIGCDGVQGYLYGRPQPAPLVEPLLGLRAPATEREAQRSSTT